MQSSVRIYREALIKVWSGPPSLAKAAVAMAGPAPEARREQLHAARPGLAGSPPARVMLP